MALTCTIFLSIFHGIFQLRSSSTHGPLSPTTSQHTCKSVFSFYLSTIFPLSSSFSLQLAGKSLSETCSSDQAEIYILGISKEVQEEKLRRAEPQQGTSMCVISFFVFRIDFFCLFVFLFFLSRWKQFTSWLQYARYSKVTSEGGEGCSSDGSADQDQAHLKQPLVSADQASFYRTAPTPPHCNT